MLPLEHERGHCAASLSMKTGSLSNSSVGVRLDTSPDEESVREPRLDMAGCAWSAREQEHSQTTLLRAASAVVAATTASRQLIHRTQFAARLPWPCSWLWPACASLPSFRVPAHSSGPAAPVAKVLTSCEWASSTDGFE